MDKRWHRTIRNTRYIIDTEYVMVKSITTYTTRGTMENYCERVSVLVNCFARSNKAEHGVFLRWVGHFRCERQEG